MTRPVHFKIREFRFCSLTPTRFDPGSGSKRTSLSSSALSKTAGADWPGRPEGPCSHSGKWHGHGFNEGQSLEPRIVFRSLRSQTGPFILPHFGSDPATSGKWPGLEAHTVNLSPGIPRTFFTFPGDLTCFQGGPWKSRKISRADPGRLGITQEPGPTLEKNSGFQDGPWKFHAITRVRPGNQLLC